MAQLKKVVEPFGEVNVYPAAGGKVRVVATILMEPHKEGAQTGIAVDGSGSMKKLYGVDDGTRILSPIFGGPPKRTNEVSPVAQKLCTYLARKIDADGGTTCIYWATGPGGGSIEEVGDLTADQAERHVFGPPGDFGTGTQLLPAVRYFEERFRSAPWGFFVFITDGELHDLDEVKEYSVRLARAVAARKRNPLKFVLIGIGPEVNESQMEELDDLDAGVPVDLWDHKLAAEMRMLEEIFAEVVDKNARVADNGVLLDSNGAVIRNFESGLPAYLEFEVAANATYFTLQVNGSIIHQALSDSASVPTSSVTASRPAESAPAKTTPTASAPATVTPAAPAPAPAVEAEEADAEWRGIDLQFDSGRGDVPDVDLSKSENEDK
jgi:cell division septation protein DedD